MKKVLAFPRPAAALQMTLEQTYTYVLYISYIYHIPIPIPIPTQISACPVSPPIPSIAKSVIYRVNFCNLKNNVRTEAKLQGDICRWL